MNYQNPCNNNLLTSQAWKAAKYSRKTGGKLKHLGTNIVNLNT